ncbi:MAG: class I SAM-dependent methyltransferase [bacterium]
MSSPAALAALPPQITHARVLWAALRFAWWWSLLDLSRRLRFESRALYGHFYDGVTSLLGETGACGPFLNYGYARLDGLDAPPRGDGLDAVSRAALDLYRRTATDGGTLGLGGLDVLEVGAGLGGGAAWLAQQLRPRRFVAVDLSDAAVRASRARHAAVPGLRFEQGDAERLAFADREFDVVLSVESSHTYPNFGAFLGEAVRVLKPGGHLLLSDFRPAGRASAFRRAIEGCGVLDDVVVEDVTANVVEALRLTSDAKESRIQRLGLPRFVADQLGYFAAVAHSEKYERFRRGDDVYLRVRARKTSGTHDGERRAIG